MKVIKKINNNAAICLDDNNNELVAIGTGIGYPACPYDLEDLNKIQRTYYDIDGKFYDLLNSVSNDILQVSMKIIDMYQSKTSIDINSNVVFTLADHLSFTIERCKKGIILEAPLQQDIQHLYEREYQAGLDALKTIKNDLNVRLPRSEASNIALHLINARQTHGSTGYIDRIMDDITNIIGSYFGIFINKDGFNYARFITHIQYLLKRQETGLAISSDNQNIFESMKKEYSEIYQCVIKIKNYLQDELNMNLDNEELLYLMLHVNRVCVREDCNRKSITSV